MRYAIILLILAAMTGCGNNSHLELTDTDVFSRKNILEIMHRVNDYALSHPWTEEDDFN